MGIFDYVRKGLVGLALIAALAAPGCSKKDSSSGAPPPPPNSGSTVNSPTFDCDPVARVPSAVNLSIYFL